MAEELSLPSEYSYFQKVYYNQELGIMYDANKTGNNRQLTTEEAIKEVERAMDKYKPALIGAKWSTREPRIQLEPRGERGYIELRAIEKA